MKAIIPALKSCIFCTNPPNSKEHLFPMWLIRKLPKGHAMSSKLADGPELVSVSYEVKVKCVCTTCNNGWMSLLEVEVKTLLSALMADLSVELSPSDQTLLAAWALKTAMVADAASGLTPFYAASECEALRLNRAIPKGTGIWLGRYFADSFSIKTGGTTIDLPDGSSIGQFHVFTALLGHAVFQVLTIHEVQDEITTQINLAVTDLPWNELLFSIHPPTTKNALWPPQKSFTNHFATPYKALIYRWNRKDGSFVRQKTKRAASSELPEKP
jgi:hypothetical protein